MRKVSGSDWDSQTQRVERGSPLHIIMSSSDLVFRSLTLGQGALAQAAGSVTFVQTTLQSLVDAAARAIETFTSVENPSPTRSVSLAILPSVPLAIRSRWTAQLTSAGYTVVEIDEKYIISVDAALNNRFSIAFDGTGAGGTVPAGVLTCGTLPDIQFDAISLWSVAAWVKVPDVATGVRTIASTAEDTPMRVGWSFDVVTENRLRIRHTADAQTPDELIVTSDAGMDPGVWHFVVATLDGTGAAGIVLYVDGVAVASTSTGTGTLVASPATTNPLTIGGATAASQGWLGHVGEVSLFGSVLSAGNVTTLYNGGQPPADTVVLALLPLHYWRMGADTVFPEVLDVSTGADLPGIMTAPLVPASITVDAPVAGL